MAPPSCPVTGKHLRWLLLVAFLSYFAYFLVHGLREPPSSRAVHICDTHDMSKLTECQSVDDAASCAGLVDADGNAASCIESSCGYQLFPHIDASVAGSSDPYDPDAATPPAAFLSVASVAYSVVPYLMGFLFLVDVLATGNLVSLTRLVVLGVIAAVNEFIFKKILTQHRPVGSCLYFLSFGMPSGHSASSIGLLVYVLLEVFVYHPNLLCGLTCQRKDQRGAFSFSWGYGWRKPGGADEPSNVAVGSTMGTNVDEDAAGDYVLAEENPIASKSPPTPSPAAAGRERWIYHLHALLYFVLLFPVPFSRVYLHDHLRLQVLYGGLIGAVASTVWYIFCIRNCGTRMIEWPGGEWGRWWGLRLGWEGMF